MRFPLVPLRPAMMFTKVDLPFITANQYPSLQQHVIGDRLELRLFKSRSNDKGSQGRECTVESDHNYVPTKVLQSGNQLWLTTQLSTHISDERVREGH